MLCLRQAEEGEREAGETDEQFEERVLNRRAAQLFAVMRPKLAAGLALAFTELAPRHNNRKQVCTFVPSRFTSALSRYIFRYFGV